MHKLLRLFVLGCLLLSYVNLQAQVGINTDGSDPDPSAMLDVQSTTKGVLVPRLSTTERQQIMNPAEGLMVYDSTAQAFYCFNGMGWLELLSGSVPTVEDGDGDTKIQVEESENEDIIRFDVAGTEKLTLSSSDSARTILTMPNNANNILIGSNTGSRTNNANGRNILIGNNAGADLLTGATNVILGHNAGQQNAAGNSNVVIGGAAAFSLPTGSSNVIIGKQAAFQGSNINTSVMIGSFAGSSAAGSGNVFIGDHAGTTETAGNRLHINNGFGNQPLIYGEFDNRYLCIDGALNIGKKYTLPNLPGAHGQVLKHNGTSTLEWASDTDMDDQTLAFDGTELTISEGNTVDISDVDTDDQTLAFDGTTLTISGGNAVDISGVDTDDQTLAFDGTTLTISGGNAVDISGVDTDDQTLSWNGPNRSISIADGNTIDLSQVTVPVGAIMMWTDGLPPAGWLICNGGPIDIAAYPELASLLQSSSVPDMQARFPIGSGQSETSSEYTLNQQGGEETVTLNLNQIPPHTHQTTVTFREGSESGGGLNYSDLRGGNNWRETYTSTAAGGTQAHNNMPPYYVINFIIKAN